MAKRMKNSFIWVSVLYVILGLILTIWPETSGLVICYIAGSILMLYGLIRVVRYFLKNDVGVPYQFDLGIGILTFVIGLLLVLLAPSVLLIFPVVIGLAIVLDGVFQFQVAADLKKMGTNRWWWELILAIFSTLIGILLLINPFAGAAALMVILGVSLLVNGGISLWSVFWLSRELRRYE